MKTIYKYKLKVTDMQAVSMPAGAKILSTQNQDDALCLWAIVDPRSPKEHRSICIVGTGNPVPEHLMDTGGSHFIGTVQQGPYVWHVFEVF